ncbi:cell division protein SepF [Xylocopilactobacillus apis]|uniref:Cell division protein SepF n=1 Tax=Xylocopilactobacillus apis TaxID=2932183 RepID=A0AAU9CQK4_9LACO|nr:cell division protein SepF [Xylocopilactobacillus apis]BDR56219.1 hypothetical protein KIMC2_07810 [Xylocopilactobacillus apis]
MAFNKGLLKNIFGSDDESEYDDIYDDEVIEDDDGVVEQERKVIPMNKQKSTAKNTVNQNKIIVVEPRIYSDAAEIVGQLKDNYAVVVNFEKIEADQAKRIIDFLSGATCAMDGTTQRVSPQIYLCTPSNFKVQANFKDSESNI